LDREHIDTGEFGEAREIGGVVRQESCPRLGLHGGRAASVPGVEALARGVHQRNVVARQTADHAALHVLQWYGPDALAGPVPRELIYWLRRNPEERLDSAEHTGRVAL